MATSYLLDEKMLKQLADDLGDDAADAFAGLTAAFERDADRSLDEIRAAVEQADPEQLRKAAHRLKGSSASLGATKVALLCQELETVGAVGDIRHAAPMVDRLEGLCLASVKALQELEL